LRLHTLNYAIAPPQYHGLWKQALLDSRGCQPLLAFRRRLGDRADPPREFEEVELKNLVEFDRRQYGAVLLVFYRPPF
jgi:hypothetical protein